MFQMQSLYPEDLVSHMRTELTDAGVEELKTVEEVDEQLKDQKGTTLLIINSVCGCAAGSARPGARLLPRCGNLLLSGFTLTR